MPHAPTLLVGERYRLLDRLASGAMGTVWLARDEQLNRDVAVKEVLLPLDLADEDREIVRARVLREARSAARLDDPTVVQVHDVVDDGVRPWIVMELVRGRTLGAAVAEQGRLASSFVATVGLAVLRALRVTHAAGILHRDVKPSNVILADDGRIVLTDFGVAQIVGDPSLTSSGMLIGSPSYMPPERARGERPGPPADLWSLGALLYAAVEGQAPFERGGALPTITAAMTEPHPPAEHASAPLRQAIDGLLIKDPAQRLDAAAAERLLREATAPIPPPPARPARPPVPVPDPVPVRDYSVLIGSGTAAPATRRRPGRAVLLGAASVVALLTGGLVGGLALDTPLRDLWVGEDAPSAATEQSSGGEPDGPTSAAPGLAPAASPTTPIDQPSEGVGPGPTTSEPAPVDSTATDDGLPAEGDSADEVTAATNGEVPAGYRLHEDETGFSVVVPADWEIERDGTLVDFEDPASGQFLRIDQTTEPKGDPVADWVAQEQSVSQRLDNYQLIGIEGVDYRGWEAADWEFTFGVDTPTHVLNRNVLTGPMAYALYWSTPTDEWDASQDIFEIAAASFQPAAG